MIAKNEGRSRAGQIPSIPRAYISLNEAAEIICLSMTGRPLDQEKHFRKKKVCTLIERLLLSGEVLAFDRDTFAELSMQKIYAAPFQVAYGLGQKPTIGIATADNPDTLEDYLIDRKQLISEMTKIRSSEDEEYNEHQEEDKMSFIAFLEHRFIKGEVCTKIEMRNMALSRFKLKTAEFLDAWDSAPAGTKWRKLGRRVGT